MSTWVKVYNSLPSHPKAVEANAGKPANAGWVFVCGLCYSNEHLTDGFIPTHALYVLCPGSTGVQDAADELVRVGLWHAVKNGWRIHDYDQVQRSGDEIRQRRLEDAERQRKRREDRAHRRREREMSQRDTAQDSATDSTNESRDESTVETRVESSTENGGVQPIDGREEGEGREEGRGQRAEKTVLLPSDDSVAGRNESISDSTHGEQPFIVDTRDAKDRRERDRATADDRALCRLLAERIKRRNPKAQVKNDAGWLRSMRLLREQDGNTTDEIRSVIDWLFDSPSSDATFWSSTIQSPAGLRSHFGQVWGKMHAPTVAADGAAAERLERQARRAASMRRVANRENGVATVAAVVGVLPGRTDGEDR